MTATPTLDRLRAAISTQNGSRPGPAARPATEGLPPIDRVLHGEWHHTAEGPVLIRDQWFPLDHAHGAFPLGAVLDADSTALTLLLRGSPAPHPERCAFFDIETTGLAGGAGTWIVLAGLGSFERAAPDVPLAFRLRQYFLAGPEYERAMLRMLANDLARFEAIVTYNGRSFDVPCVESRLTLSRIASPCHTLAHLDLLHPVRRLYAHRMPACRLADVERELLHIERPDDIPGHLIPALYRDYLLGGRAHFLRGVLRHNAEDVISLVGILAALVGLTSRDDHDPDDAIAVARWCEGVGEWQRSIVLYARALPWLEGTEDWAWAAWRYSLLLRRAARWSEAAPLWWSLWHQGHRGAALELAKYLEHRARSTVDSKAVVARLLDGATGQEQQALAHRYARLERKIASIRLSQS
jgi:uncharacterized protein YprB with RNaseH-like and TPR domain